MKLIELLKYVKPIAIIGDADVDITGVNIDSRKIEKGHLFVAIKGTQTDGHRFIPKALELGAVAVLCEDLPVPDEEPSGTGAGHQRAAYYWRRIVEQIPEPVYGRCV